MKASTVITFVVAFIGLQVAESIGLAGHYLAQGALQGFIMAAVYVSGGHDENT